MTAAVRPPTSGKEKGAQPCARDPGKDRARHVVVHVIHGKGAWPVDAEEIVTHAVKAALAVAPSAPQRGEIAVLLTDDKQLADLNMRFRNREGPTDVLSFPGACSFPDQSDIGDAPIHIGDIAIAYERCARDAADLGRPLAFHLSHLVIHGALHCLGHDHEREEEARAMESCERAALATLGWGEPYPDPVAHTQNKKGDER